MLMNDLMQLVLVNVVSLPAQDGELFPPDPAHFTAGIYMEQGGPYLFLMDD